VPDDAAKVRLHKFLAHHGVASRRAAEELVEQGRVTVNGEVRRRLPVLVDPSVDKVVVDGETVGQSKRQKKGPRFVYVMLNKPPGVVCTNSAQQTAGRTQRRAIDLLPPDFRRRVYPVGRLDASSRGLLLLTDDGDLTHKLTHPSFGVPKTYRVACDGEVTPDVIEELQRGVFLVDRETQTGRRTAPSRIKIVRRNREGSVLEMTIKEGRNRQVRRMLASLGHKVRDLKRTRLGPLQMRQLPDAASRLLSPREVAELHDAVRGQQR
jgi:23S rRNA pseudouridine2605 synthase